MTTYYDELFHPLFSPSAIKPQSSSNPELLRQCIGSGQVSAAQIVAHEADTWKPADIEATGEWSEAL